MASLRRYRADAGVLAYAAVPRKSGNDEAETDPMTVSVSRRPGGLRIDHFFGRDPGACFHEKQVVQATSEHKPSWIAIVLDVSA